MSTTTNAARSKPKPSGRHDDFRLLRTAAMNKRIRSAHDREALRLLSKVNGDQGRLGGLLRMYLKDPDAAGSIARALLDQIKSVQRDLAEAARKVK